jgi:hypothetical protein
VTAVREAEWLACARPDTPLNFAQRKLHRKVLRRKQRLLVCACCRLLWPLLTDPRSRHAVEVGERFASGIVTPTERDAARQTAEAVLKSLVRGSAAARVAWAARLACYAGEDLRMAVDQALSCVVDIEVLADLGPFRADIAGEWKARRAAAWAHTCDLVRDVFGPLPFRCPHVEAAWLAWGEATVPRIARAVDDELAFDRLPILADALEDAGCADEDILRHCRGPGPHGKGCWVVDLLLGESGGMPWTNKAG